MGLLNLAPDKPFWDFPLPSGAMDTFGFAGTDRRQLEKRVLSHDKRAWSHAFPGTHLMLELWRHADFTLVIPNDA